MKVILHVHTKYSSDSNLNLIDIVKILESKGVHGISITDHDTMEGVSKAKTLFKKHNLILIPGIEISTNSGHVIGLYLNESIRRGLSPEETLDAIKEQDGISIIPHPLDRFRSHISIGNKITYLDFDCIEVFNSRVIFEEDNRKALEASKKLRKIGVSGNDSHFVEELGSNYLEISSDIYSALRKGNFEIKYTRILSLLPHVKSNLLKLKNKL